MIETITIKNGKAYRISTLTAEGAVASAGEVVSDALEVELGFRYDDYGLTGASITSTLESLTKATTGPCAIELWAENSKGDLLRWVFPFVESGELYENEGYGVGICKRFDIPCTRIWNFMPVRRSKEPQVN